VLLRDVTWAECEARASARGKSAAPRLTYDRGTLEILSPSKNHEHIKKTVARLLEQWAKVGEGQWLMSELRGGTLRLDSIDATLLLDDLWAELDRVATRRAGVGEGGAGSTEASRHPRSALQAPPLAGTLAEAKCGRP